jgi:hypothetical protein
MPPPGVAQRVVAQSEEDEEQPIVAVQDDRPDGVSKGQRHADR